jgi:hypothetical protein
VSKPEDRSFWLMLAQQWMLMAEEADKLESGQDRQNSN